MKPVPPAEADEVPCHMASPPRDGSNVADLAEFARWHVASGDIDPAYPVLAALIDRWGLDPEEAIRFVLLYVAFYDLGSAVSAWDAGAWTPGRGLDHRFALLPTGTERRGLRGGINLLTHIDSLDGRAAGGSLLSWLTSRFTGDPRTDWKVAEVTIRSVEHNGRWAAYKTGEILATVCKLPIEPTDAGHDFSSGPRAGLALVYPKVTKFKGARPGTVAALDDFTEELRVDLAGRGVPLPVEQLETVLCDWHAVVEGRYYVGHDWDMMMEQVNRPHVTPEALADIMAARAVSTEARWLGEFNDWSGVRKPLKRLYKDHGCLDWWTE